MARMWQRAQRTKSGNCAMLPLLPPGDAAKDASARLQASNEFGFPCSMDVANKQIHPRSLVNRKHTKFIKISFSY